MEQTMKKMTTQEFNDACNEFGHSWDNAFVASWSTGGTHNDCWGGSYPITPEAPQELKSLDRFLTKYFPAISFMQYKAISNFVNNETTQDSDYYGGCTYGVKISITYDNLMDSLQSLDLLLIIDEDK